MARKYELMGEVNLLGLNAFGGAMSPLWGAIIGGGVSGATSLTLGHIQNGRLAKDREFWGLLAGLAASGALFAMRSTRQSGAAFASVVGTLFAAGIPWLEKKLLGTVQLPAAVAAAAATTISGMGYPQVNYLNGGRGLRGAQVSYLNGLGIPAIAPVPQSVGTIPGVAGPGPAFAGTSMGLRAPVSLLGQPSERSNQVTLLGGPAIHGLSSAYGATLLGQGR